MKKIITAALIIFLISDVHAQSLPKKPNIIFILADDVGFYNITVNGGQSFSTPNIDSMARHGRNFTHCESAPLCCASRSMLLTGKYLNRNYSNWGYMNADEKTIANVMKDAGYVTEIFGKFQFEYSVQQMQSWGWDRHIIFELTEDTMTYRRYKNPVLRENGYRIPDAQMANKYCDDVLTDRLMKFIDSNKTRPFFAYYPMSIGHDPFSPTPDDAEFAAWNPNHPSDTTFYPSMMKYMDKKVGEILDKLRTAGIANNTLVIFAGDNGTPNPIFYRANGQTLQGEKGKTTEGGTHVPMIAYWPAGIQQPGVNDDLIDFTDFLPTLAQAGGLKNLTPYGNLDGLSFYQKILGQPGKTKKQLYCFYDPEVQKNDSLRIWERDKTYKLYDSTEIAKSGMFFNVVNDPYELSPLKDSKLTVNEKNIKNNFKLILDTSYNWPANPILSKPFVNQITSISAVVGGTINSTGASALIEKGSSITTSSEIFLGSSRQRDYNNLGLGKFSETRTGLKPQTQYKFLVYGMNNNKSHSTGTVQGVFKTLSSGVLKQSTKLTGIQKGNQIFVEWDDATFPASGATKAGYLIIYTTGEPAVIENANGKAPEEIALNGKTIISANTALPSLPLKKTSFSVAASNSNYTLMLIPYTWDGVSTSTCNYFIKNALKTKVLQEAVAFDNTSGNKIEKAGSTLPIGR